MIYRHVEVDNNNTIISSVWILFCGNFAYLVLLWCSLTFQIILVWEIYSKRHGFQVQQGTRELHNISEDCQKRRSI
jgi:hypothetical protein